MNLPNSVTKTQLSQRIGKRIAELRKRRDLSQSDLARLLMRDRQTIERLEKGRTNPTIYTLYEVANALGVSLEELLK